MMKKRTAKRNMKMKRILNWAVLGCGSIANEMAMAMVMNGRSFYSVANRTHAKAMDFADNYDIDVVYDSIDDLFEDEKVDAVYIATPHNTHFEFIKRALESGKHVLVEKSITLNLRELDEVISLAENRGLFLAEAQTIWHMPLYKKLWKMVKEERYGKVNLMTINFGSFKPYDMSLRFYNMDLAGGALLDIGIYALSVMRGFMKESPDLVLDTWIPSPTGSDENSALILRNASNQLATLMISIHSRQPKRAMISMEKAYIEIMNYPRAEKAVIVDAESGEKSVIEAGDTENALFYEILDAEKAIISGNHDIALLGYSRDVMKIMTDLRKKWDLKYPGEQW